MSVDLSVYLVTDQAMATAAGHSLPDLVGQAVVGGVSAVQIREKNAPAREFLATVERVAERLPARVALIVNDRIDVFLAARASGVAVTGVHVGQDDLPAAVVRSLVGQEALLGVSVGTEAEARAAADAGADYLGVGPLRPTATKADTDEALGETGCAALIAAGALPVVVIGGVKAPDLPGLRRAGAAGTAVVSAICAAADPAQAARRLRESWEAGR